MHKIKHFFRNISLTTPVAIIIGAIIIGGSHFGYGIVTSGTGTKVGTAAVMFNGKAIDDSDLATGNTKSKVIIVEYSDTECPFCAQLHPTMKKLAQEYASKVGFVYRYFPLTQIHPHSFEESRAVYCVGKLMGAQKREEYIDVMFATKTNNQNMVLPSSQSKEILAQNLGVNKADLTKCLADQESNDAINASIQDGIAAGVQGTPATFVLIKTKKGYEVVSMVDGARPYEYLKAAIDQALAR